MSEETKRYFIQIAISMANSGYNPIKLDDTERKMIGEFNRPPVIKAIYDELLSTFKDF